MKVKNIMFSGFAAAILMGVVAEANAAPVAVASKGYVDSIAGKLESLSGAAADKENLVDAINVKLDPVDEAGGALEEGEYYSNVAQATDGQVTVVKSSLATAIDATTLKAPTTAAVYNAIQGVSGQTSDLDLDAVGGDGKYVKLVSQADGQLAATEGTIDTEMDRLSPNPVTNAAIATALGFKQDLLRLGDNLSYNENGELTAKDTTYTGTGYINIDGNNVITATGLQPTITDGTDATTTTGFISSVTQTNGTVDAAATAFDTEINATTGTNTNTAPTTAAVYSAIQGVSGQTTDLDLDEVGDDGKYIKYVSQSDGQVSAVTADFDTVIDATTAGHDDTAPTTSAVYTAIDAVADQTSHLNLAEVGGDGKYVYYVKQENGQVAASAADLDTAMSTTSTRPVTNKAITEALAEKQDKLTPGNFVAIDEDGNITTTYTAGNNIAIGTDGKIGTKFPEMPGVCTGTGVTCVLTSEGGEFKWAVLTKPVSDTTISGTEAQAQVISEPVTGGESENPGL